MEKILIMGLPGSGKTYMAEALKKYLEENGEIVMTVHYRNLLPISIAKLNGLMLTKFVKNIMIGIFQMLVVFVSL
jgi:tRNA uridine 5-carbamoylmethylation protein Kti12